jgi:hypothetical protein
MNVPAPRGGSAVESEQRAALRGAALEDRDELRELDAQLHFAPELARERNRVTARAESATAVRVVQVAVFKPAAQRLRERHGRRAALGLDRPTPKMLRISRCLHHNASATVSFLIRNVTFATLGGDQYTAARARAYE